jgi:type III restriction enzyme
VTKGQAPKINEPDPYGVPLRRRPSDNTHLVNGVRAAVDAWRAQGYPRASATTRRLLNYWFEDDHVMADGQPFRFYFCQREAVETFIYLTEIAQVASFSDLLEFASHAVLVQPGQPKRQRLAFKMATGSGKTLAMSLCIVWSYFHALNEQGSRLATSFLIIAPNVIVFERLKLDFGDGLTFRRDPLIPPEWAEDFAMTVVLQDELVPVMTRGVIFLTNIHRLYEPAKRKREMRSVPNPVEALVGPRVDRDIDAYSGDDLFRQISDRNRIVVINDEAHHVHDEKLRWNETIERLHAVLVNINADEAGSGVLSQLDFSATPRDQKGVPFRHIVVDYPLAQAVADGIVKTPLIGEIEGASLELGETAVQRYRRWLDVAVARWRKFDEVLTPAGRRPVLFVMCEDTEAADEIGDHLATLKDFKGDRLRVIHTNRSGEIEREKDLDEARKAVREIDRADSPIRCIVSVLMLREGWDVRNVCVIVTLRSLTAAAKILPEQALGRGLRRMTPPGSGFDERLVVVEHPAFRDLWSSELDGGLVVEREDADKIQPGAVAIFPDEGKSEFDIAVPQLSRVISRSETPLDELKPETLPEAHPRLDVPDAATLDEYIRYRGIHLFNRAEIERDKFHVPFAEDPSGVIWWYTKQVLKAGGIERMSGAFAAIAPMVRSYLERKVFDRPVDLADKAVLRRLAENDAQQIVVSTFQAAIRGLTIKERESVLVERTFKLSQTPAFPWSRDTLDNRKTVFNLTPVENALERRFAQFLQVASDVAAFAKLTMNSRFALEYISATGALRYYYPDFVVRLTDGKHLVMETKGIRDPDVPLKDRRARRWCQDATRLSGVDWFYERVDMKVFDKFTGETVDALRRLIAAQPPADA